MIETIRAQTAYPVRGQAATEYRAERSNGWHCGHWHRSPEEAAECFDGRWRQLLHGEPGLAWSPPSRPRIADYIREALSA